MPETITRDADVVLSFDFPSDPQDAIRSWRTAALRAEALQADYVASRAYAYLSPPEGEEKWTDGKREAYAKSSTVKELQAASAAAIEAKAREWWAQYVLSTDPGVSVLDIGYPREVPGGD